jgi:chorismate lyase / 3-hydroxybenzoate synthase
MALRLQCGGTAPPDTLLSLFAPGTCPLTTVAEHPQHWLGAADDVAVEVWQADEAEDIAAVARQAYAELRERLLRRGYPQLLRTWTYFDRINEGLGDAERYRQFCIGRAAGLNGHQGHPAATVIGSHRPGFWLWAIAGRQAGVAVENPRQIPAWAYPQTYGPQSPGFTRALWLESSGLLLVSGTSSVVGHATAHPNDLPSQFAETRRNLGALVERAQTLAQGPLHPVALRIYVRRLDDVERVRQAIASWLPELPASIQIGDVCRRDLTLEIEAVYAAGADFTRATASRQPA